MSYTFIKEINYSEYSPQPILAISNEIKTLKIAETYDGFGQKVGHYNAGDYSLYNSVSSAETDCLQSIVDHFKLDINLDLMEIDNHSLEIIFNYENNKYDEGSINDFIQQWEKENSNYSECSGFDYWDGSNFKTVIVSIDQYEPSHEIIEVQGLNNEIDEAIHIESKSGKHLYESENFWMIESQYATAFEKYSIYLKNEVDRDTIF